MTAADSEEDRGDDLARLPAKGVAICPIDARTSTNCGIVSAWLAAATADLIEFDSEDEKLADAALAAVEDIAHHRQRGKVLGKRNVSGDLNGFLRLRFDAPDQRPQRYRIVYRLTSNGNPTTVEIIAIGLRADHQIYRQAVSDSAGTQPRQRGLTRPVGRPAAVVRIGDHDVPVSHRHS